jgi:hypothetical protein
MQPHLLSLTPPAMPLTPHNDHHADGGHCAENTTPTADNSQTQRQEARSVFFASTHLFLRSFSL